MSNLNNALERIMSWLKDYQPEFADSFLPGLKSEEISQAEAELGFNFPSEIYELYQWRNGTEQDAKAICFPTFEFLPLHEAVESTRGINEYIDEFTEFENPWYGSPLFVFIENNCHYCGVPIINLPKEKIPVVLLEEAEMPALFYTSITDMMQTLAECYETGAYYLDKEEFVEANESKVADIFRNYNDLSYFKKI